MTPTRRRFALYFLLVLPSAVLGSLQYPETARSFPIYPPYLPNRATATASDNTSQPCISCHDNPNGGQGCTTFPCLNPFGVAFMSNSHVWSPTLAMIDSDGDGYTNGQELQDPSGTWTVELPSPGVATQVTLPGFDSMNVLPSFLSRYSPGMSDIDQDGYCWFGQDMNGDRDCLDSGEKLINAIDCDDNVAAVNSAATELCTNAIDDDCNGLDTIHDPACAAVVDGDHDGYCPTGRDLNADHDCIDAGENTADVDCNDTNLLIRPGAAENCQDTLDNDCDTFVDILDSNCTGEGDFDADGYCPIGQDANDDGDCLDVGESVLPSDCNDQDANVNPGKLEICGNLQDDDCDQLADFGDGDCATFADADDDGYCNVGKDVNRDGDCADVGVDIMNVAQGYDCNDLIATIYSVATEICTDLVDQDCDGAVALTDPDCAGYLDQDRDDFCPVGGIDLNNDFDCADAGEFSFLYDCLDVAMVGWPAPALVKPTAIEICTNTVDDNCNGIADASATGSDPACLNFEDSDFDGFCHPGTDVNLDGDCSDLNEQTASDDTAPNDPTVSPGNHESCYDMRDNDLDGQIDLADSECVNTHDSDGDGYCPIGKDVNADGDCADVGENFKLSDCDDDNDAIGPQMSEVYVEGALVQRCFDGDDNDCNGNWDTGQRGDAGCGYLYDRDSDGVCGHGLDDNGDGDCVDTDEQRFGDDCDDDDPVRASSLIEACADQVDNDCNDLVDAADPSCQCQLVSQCAPAGACQIAVCNQGVCQYDFDPDCTDAGPRRGGGGLLCGVSAGTAAAPSLLAGLTLLAAALAIFARRGGRALRSARFDRSRAPRGR